jgi:hypothetical protein
MSRFEQAQADGDAVLARRAARDARLAALETRQRRGFKFPVEVHVNKTPKRDFQRYYEDGERFYAIGSDLNHHDKRLKALEARIGIGS